MRTVRPKCCAFSLIHSSSIMRQAGSVAGQEVVEHSPTWFEPFNIVSVASPLSHARMEYMRVASFTMKEID